MMNPSKQTVFSSSKGQTAIEYILLLTVVMTVVLVGFRAFLPRIQAAGNVYFNKAATDIMGKPNPCGPGCWDKN